MFAGHVLFGVEKFLDYLIVFFFIFVAGYFYICGWEELLVLCEELVFGLPVKVVKVEVWVDVIKFVSAVL
jgi:hypothetical protein